MAKVTVNRALTPRDEIVAEANKIVRATDSLGRSLGIRRITMSVRRRVLKALSAESAEKDKYLGLAMLAAACCEIDGETEHLPTSELQFDALIDRLDDAGIEAIAKCMGEHFGIGKTTDVVDDAKN